MRVVRRQPDTRDVWCDPASSHAGRREAEVHIIEALPALRALGLFEVLTIRDERLKMFVDACPPSVAILKFL